MRDSRDRSVTGKQSNHELSSVQDERDQVMILVNLLENSDAADETELDALRQRLKDLERRVQAGLREMDYPSVKIRRLRRSLAEVSNGRVKPSRWSPGNC
ncbi:MAG: hypothetical protein NVS3B5_13180 [Sphingomicrobium sp.]